MIISSKYNCLMRMLLVICGPTATGKTSLAAHMAQKFNGEIISADSRQVYKYMDVGTGKDTPKDMKVWGYDLVMPNKDFSVSHYLSFANKALGDIYTRGKLPILVGGTGLYVKAVVDQLDRVHVPRNLKLRKKLEKFAVPELYQLLLSEYPSSAQALNNSDRSNPRRLIRLFEILSSKKNKGNAPNQKFDSVLWIGLTAPSKELAERIARRVDHRARNGMPREIEFLKENGFFEHMPSRTMGYKDWPDLAKWRTEEIKYAKRQMTWFKKETRVNWFDITKPKYEYRIENLVKKWHNKPEILDNA